MNQKLVSMKEVYLEKRITVLILGIACLLLSNLSIAQESTGKLFIIGGGKRPPEMIRFLMDEAEIQSTDAIAILPWSSIEPDSSSYFAMKQFKAHGHETFLDIQPNELSEVNEAIRNRFLNCKLIYIPGGDQRRFMDYADSSGFDDLLRQAFNNGAIIAGTSAGAAIMSDKMITGDQLKHPQYHPTFQSIEPDNIELDQGLGFLSSNIIIDQHFVTRSRYNRLLTAVIEDPGLEGWGIEESTAAYVVDNKVKIVGEGQLVRFRNQSKKSRSVNGLLGEEEILISVLLPGDEFEF